MNNYKTANTLPPLEKVALTKAGYHPSYFIKPVKQDYSTEIRKVIEARQKNPQMFEKFDKDLMEYFISNNGSNDDIIESAEEEIKKALTFYEGTSLHICGASAIGFNSKNPTLELCWAIPVECKKEGDVVYPTNDQNDFCLGDILAKARSNIAGLLHNNTATRIYNVSDQTKAIVFQLRMKDVAVRCRLSINTISNVRNTYLIANYAKLDQRFLIIGRVFQDWAMIAGIYGLIEDSFDIYTLSYMLIHYFQCVVSPPIFPNLLMKEPALFDEGRSLKELDNKITKIPVTMDPPNTMPVGDLFLGFIRYYGFFPYHDRAISPRIGCAFEKTSNDEPFFVEQVYGNGSSSKIVTLEGLDLIKCTIIDAYTSHVQGPHLATLIKDQKCFMIHK